MWCLPRDVGVEDRAVVRSTVSVLGGGRAVGLLVGVGVVRMGGAGSRGPSWGCLVKDINWSD